MRRIALLLALAFCGCDQPKSEVYAPEQKRPFKPVTAELEPAISAQKFDGIATLLSPDPLTQLNAEIRGAEISAAFSERTVGRFKGTTTLGEHRLDNAERQFEMDATQVALLELKLRNTWGDTAPFLSKDTRQSLVDELSAGKIALVRLDFPRSFEPTPKEVRVTPLGGGKDIPVDALWPAPSGNLAMPGMSFLGLISTGPGLRPGDRAKVTAEYSKPASGVIIPSSAVVVSAGESWIYIKNQKGEFERKRVLLTTPVAEGYLSQDFSAGTSVVVQGASALLSREAEPGSFDDDNDDDHDRRQLRQPENDKGDVREGSTPLARAEPD